MVFKIFSTIFVIIVIVNLNIIHGQNYVSNMSSGTCPPNFELRNGLCYSNLSKCPPEYFLHTDGLCYPKEQKPCPADKQNQTENISETTTILPTITTTSATPFPVEIKRLTCPNGSIVFKNKCRKVFCNLGELYRGACHRPICPQGLVWRGKQCQKPAFVTTVIEIDNIFKNEINEKPFALEINEHNKIINQTTEVISSATTNPSTSLNIREPNLMATTESYKIKNETCCHVIAPRICKKYIKKWQCYNRKYNICDNRVCIAPIVYLKAPEIKFEPPILVMPPNPQLNDCQSTRNMCNADVDIVDCSGCAEGSSEKCSPYCYAYICSSKNCTFMDLKDYCRVYLGQNGCMRKNGCLWNWCTNSE